MVVTSVAPNTRPIATKMTASTIMPVDRMAERCLTPASGTTTGGSVARWDRNHSPPTTAATRGTTSPADGDTLVASTVASTGPTTNTSSSSADSSEYAVCRRRASGTTCVQRARTIEPYDPCVAPETAANT